jgi:hypothetical protein
MNELKQRPAIDLLGSNSEKARESVVDLPQVAVTPGDGEQLNLGAFRARQVRMAKGGIDG